MNKLLNRLIDRCDQLDVYVKPADSIVNLQAAINRYLAERNAEPRPFVRTASAASILAKVTKFPAVSE